MSMVHGRCILSVQLTAYTSSIKPYDAFVALLALLLLLDIFIQRSLAVAAIFFDDKAGNTN